MLLRRKSIKVSSSAINYDFHAAVMMYERPFIEEALSLKKKNNDAANSE